MNLIKEKRLTLGLSQKEFADALGLGKNGDRTLRRWENGEISPSNLELQAILHFAQEVPFPPVSSEECEFLFIDLFAGIGGIRLPFQELKGRCVFSSEWNEFAAKTYFFNYGERPSGDITLIEASEIPDHDILLGGFPCQPFSQAGLHKGFVDSRGNLFFEIERILKKKRPKAFLLENVKQLVGHDKGNTLRVMLEHLEAINYHVDYQILRAADYGLPQNRERIYLVGFNRDFFPSLDEFYHFPYPMAPHSKTRVGDILENEVDKKYTISDKLWQSHQRRREEHKAKGNGFGYSLFTSDSPYTSTISARYYKDGSEILIDQGEGKNPRKLTPRECARLQGFPENFIIPVSDSQAYRQFGNSVAVPVIRAIATNMVSELKRLSKEANI